MSCEDLDVITSIVKVEGKLVNQTPLRIGYGETQDFQESIDNPIIKYKEKPIIPGSSLKGALRSLAESYVKSLKNEDIYRMCKIEANNDFTRVCDIGETEEKCKSCEDNKYCIPCILFGFKDLSSRVYILDAIAEEFSTSQRTMVAINRVFGGQMPGRLYTLDYVEPGAKFNFTMYIYNLNIVDGEKDWKCVAVQVMKYLLRTLATEGIFIGARKSVGFGLIKLLEGKVTLYQAPDLITPKKELPISQVI